MCAQHPHYDTVIVKKAYTSYFSKNACVPVVVTYKLYKAGGACNRKNDRFINDISSLKMAVAKDYSHSGYDKGHMANAEDFAFDAICRNQPFATIIACRKCQR